MIETVQCILIDCDTSHHLSYQIKCSGVVPMGPPPKYFEKMKKINYFGAKSILHRFCTREIYPPRQVHQGGIIFLLIIGRGRKLLRAPSG